jgi:membrane-associated phospholipid phosphatase
MEPYIWGAGVALSLTTEYLRIAADRHYFSDVFVGGLVGLGSGLLIPRLMRRDLEIVPTSNGAAVAGTF